MRENMGKFRGKNTYGKWFYGSLIRFENNICCIFTMQKHDAPIDLCFYEVEPETVGEFTGLQDSNGKEIYEGDICKVRLNSEKPDAIGVIVFTRGCYYWNEYFLYEVIHELEVINNIHDNPELLEK